MTPRGALRRSLVVWGWGQHAAGAGRRVAILPVLQLAAVAGLAAAAPRLVSGTGLPVLVAAGALVLATWAAVAVDAWRRAGRRRARLGLPPGDTAAIDLLWLAPIGIALWAAAWGIGGRAGQPGTVLAAYLADWEAGRDGAAAGRFVDPPAPAALDTAWEQQLTALRNDLLKLPPTGEGAAPVDPDHPVAALRWVDSGTTPNGDWLVSIEAARATTVDDLLFGFLPVTSQRLVPVARLGSVELRPVPADGGANEWRIVGIEVAGVVVGAAPDLSPR